MEIEDRMLPITRLGLVCSGGLLIVLGGCSVKPVSATSGKPHAAQAVETSLAEARVRQVPRTLNANGSLVAGASADIMPQVAERIQAVLVRVGQPVSQGTALVTLDRGNLELRLEQAKAAAGQARAALLQAESRAGVSGGAHFEADKLPEVISARAAADLARTQAEMAAANERRYKEALRTGDVSQVAYEQIAQQARSAEEQMRVAAQQLSMALSAARQSYQMVAGAQAGLAGAQVQVAMAERELQNATVRAPFSGLVSALHAGAGQMAGPAAKVATMVRIQDLEAHLQIPEREQGSIRPGLEVRLRVAAYGGRAFSGEVRGVSPSIDPVMRTFNVIAAVANPEGLLRPGMFATSTLELAERQTMIFVPESAVVREAGSSSASVFTVDNNVAVQRIVRTGEPVDGDVPLLAGLEKGAKVAVLNTNLLFDGAPVRVSSK